MAAGASDAPPDSVCLNRMWYNLLVLAPGSHPARAGAWDRHMSDTCRQQLRRYFSDVHDLRLA